MVVKAVHVQEDVNGFVITVEYHSFPLGERLGFQYAQFKHKFIFVIYM